MKPNTHTVQQLFERDVRYVVPLYQRPYVWDEDHQWAPLWDDISALLAHQEADGVAGLWSHFLGALVLEQENTSPGQVPRYTVIDGQQRLTTLQLLLAAAARSLARVGAPNDSALVLDLVVNNPLKTKGTDQLKVWPTNANRAAFEAVMALSQGESPPEGPELIGSAFAFFADRTLEYLTGVADEDVPEDEAEALAAGAAEQEDSSELRGVAPRAERLRVTLCELLKVVSISLEADDNAQVIFETLNARGTPLLALDLVKNAVFYQLTKQGGSPDAADDLYYKTWQPELELDYWRSERRQGRLFRPAGELFLMHWLTMQVADVVPATELFATFRTKILTPEAQPDGIISELSADAATMRSFDNHDHQSAEGQFFRRFAALDASTTLPVVLLLFRSAEVSPARRRRALRILESWLARRALMRLTAKNYNRLVPRLIARMRKDLAHADDALLVGLSGGEGDISRWPDDDEFEEFLRTRDLYGTVSQPRLVMALSAVEESLYSSKVDIPQLASNLSLEHLLPQGWEETWMPLIDDNRVELDGEDLESAVAARWSRLHRLGNLTIVTGPLNSSLSNAPWLSKRKHLNAHGKLLLNAPLNDLESWGPDDIDARGAALAANLAAIWPGPSATSWPAAG